MISCNFRDRVPGGSGAWEGVIFRGCASFDSLGEAIRPASRTLAGGHWAEGLVSYIAHGVTDRLCLGVQLCLKSILPKHYGGRELGGEV
jgi:hypothetical protein